MVSALLVVAICVNIVQYFVYDSKTRKFNNLFSDVAKDKLIPEHELIIKIEQDFFMLKDNFNIYNEKLSHLTEYTAWYDTVITPYISDYSGYIKTALSTAEFLPFGIGHLLKIVNGKVIMVIKYGDKITELNTFIDEFRNLNNELNFAVERYTSTHQLTEIANFNKKLDLHFVNKMDALSKTLFEIKKGTDVVLGVLENANEVNNILTEYQEKAFRSIRSLWSSDDNETSQVKAANSVQDMVNSYSNKIGPIRETIEELEIGFRQNRDAAAKMNSLMEFLQYYRSTYHQD